MGCQVLPAGFEPAFSAFFKANLLAEVLSFGSLVFFLTRKKNGVERPESLTELDEGSKKGNSRSLLETDVFNSYAAYK